MFLLIIPKSKSKFYPDAIKCALEMSGTFDGEEIKLEIDDYLHIYNKVFPILKYNVTNWKGTKAFYKGKKVHPYKFMLQKHLSIKIAVNEVMKQVDKRISNEYEYYKRIGNKFYFKNDDFSFDIELKGKELYEFLEENDIGDVLIFDELSI